MTPEELSAEVREAFAYAARYVSLLTRNNPQGTVASVLSRPDTDAILAEALSRGREQAEDAVRTAWAENEGPQSPYLAWLLGDIVRSYDALTLLRHAIRDAWQSVPPRPFIPGTSPPGSHPGQEAAAGRADAVRDAVLAFGAEIAMRNQLTLGVAGTAARALRVIADGSVRAQAGEHITKTWRTSRQPPDERTCHWCRQLNGATVPLHASFPQLQPEDLTGHGRLTRPPRRYHGVLHGPPLHPGPCRCHLELSAVPGVTGEGGQENAGSPLPNTPAAFLAAAGIRALPDQQYRSLLAFLRAAVHELGQLLKRLAEAVSGHGK